MALRNIRPICFVAMPFGKKTPPGLRKPQVDFDRIFSHIARSATAAGMEVIRADFEPSGGFIHKPMYQRLLVAEYVVADLTLGNPNVMSSRLARRVCGHSLAAFVPRRHPAAVRSASAAPPSTPTPMTYIQPGVK